MTTEEQPVEAPAATAVPVETTATATVNAPEMVTLWSRSTGIEVGSYSRDDAAALSASNPDLTPIKYDLDGAEEELLSALSVVAPVATELIAARKRLGYVPEGNEGAWNAAMGRLQKAAQTVSLALGASLPTEGEVRSWSEHRAALGDINTDMFPNLHRAVNSSAAIDAYVAEKGGA